MKKGAFGKNDGSSHDSCRTSWPTDVGTGRNLGGFDVQGMWLALLKQFRYVFSLSIRMAIEGSWHHVVMLPVSVSWKRKAALPLTCLRDYSQSSNRTSIRQKESFLHHKAVLALSGTTETLAISVSFPTIASVLHRHTKTVGPDEKKPRDVIGRPCHK